MPLTHRFLHNIRSLHLYLGVFTAPMLLFLAFTGGLQTFGLHEAARGSDYRPPAWLVSLSHLHKKQSLAVPVPHRPRPPLVADVGTQQAAPATRVGGKADAAASPKSPLPMKVFFALVALSLFVSVLSGLYMAWRHTHRRRLLGAILFAGCVVPLLLLLV
jgi:hypothetical protein